jgi:ribosomal-protein-alanine N-acetyltransferase
VSAPQVTIVPMLAAHIDALMPYEREMFGTEAFLEVRVDNEPARALYLREGFTELGVRRGYYDNGRVDAVVMTRVL